MMMNKCTDPQRWGATAEPSFSEDQAEAYIMHLRECPFHAEADMRSHERVGSIAEIARGTVGKRLLMLRKEEVARIRGILSRRIKLGDRSPIKMLSIRVNGVERTLVDLNKKNRITIEADESALISVWKPREGDEEQDLRLTTYFLSDLADLANGNGASRHSVTLEGGQIISFEVERREDSGALITVDYCETPLAIERVKNGYRAALQWMLWQGGIEKAAAAFILVVAVIIVLKLVPGFEQREQIALKQEQQQEIEKQKPGNVLAEPPPNSVQKNMSGNPATLAGRVEAPSVPKRKRPESITSNTDPGTRSPAGIVRRIYIGNGFNPDLRQALADSFNTHGVTLAESEKEADAILEAGPVRAIRMDVELVTPSQEPLWWGTVKSSEEGSTNAKDVAQKIVKDMLGKLDSIKRTSTREP